MTDYAAVTSNLIKNIRKGGLTGGWWFLRQQFLKLLAPEGEPIYETDWDVLVVLDACRLDLMREVAPEYDFLEPVECFNSRGATTTVWMSKNFVDDYSDHIAETAYVCANPYSGTLLSDDDFDLLDQVWQYSWDDESGTVPARPVTDRAITVGREHDPERMIVHYLQPHQPFIGGGRKANTELSDIWGGLDTTWNELESGELTREDFWEMYRENLTYVLDDVELLLGNIEAETVIITSDHGNALGERGIYGHSGDHRIPCLYQVPWSETSASDSGEYEPNTYDIEQSIPDDPEGTIQDRLADLGYTMS